MISVLIVDDEDDSRELLVLGLRRLGMEALGARDGLVGLDAMLGRTWDVVVIDLIMPRMDGIGLLQAMKDKAMTSVRIVITSFADKERAVAALNHGADYLLEKPFVVKQLDEVIRRLTHDRNWNFGNIDRLAQDKFRSLNLSERERELINHVLKGASNKQIAAHFAIGEQTVKNYLSALYLKLGISGRTELVRILFTP